jgi:gelsolin
MLKPKVYNIAESNIANLGTDLEKKIRENASNGEPAWKTAGTAVGLEIWRVEKFKIVCWPKEEYGKFYSGDSYIVLNTYKKENALKWDVHFWLGTFTSQDEAGTAAYKTVELDDHLKGAPGT